MKSKIAASACFVFLLAVLASCSSVGRHIAGNESDIRISSDLRVATADFLGYIASPAFTVDKCAPVLGQVYEKLFNTPASYFDRDVVDKSSGESIQNIWKARLALRTRLADFAAAGTVDLACIDAARDVLRAARFMEDYIGERELKPAPFDGKHGEVVWAPGSPHTLVSPRHPELERDFDIRKVLRDGDILLSRGSAFTSAAIARIGNSDSQFSHLALIHIDDKGQIWAIEAHIEVGSIVSPFEKYLADGKVRSALYRYPDPVLAAEAARMMFDDVRAQSARGENIPYDFALDADNHDALFCSEIVSFGYELASRGSVRLPAYPSRLDRTNDRFLKLIGVKARSTFLPGDVEVDPRLELVAEWRDYSRMKETRMKDAVLTKMYEWMNRYGYELKGGLKSWFARELVWDARRWPLFSRMLKGKFPKNMSRSALGTITVLNDVAGAIYEELEKAEAAHLRETGLSMTARELYDTLDAIRTSANQNFRKKFGPAHDRR